MDNKVDNKVPDDKINIVENKLRELRDEIEKMEKQNAELFANLGIGPHQLEELLSDRSLYTKEAYDFIQRERKALQDILDNRIESSSAKIKREKTSEVVGGHWIFVR